MPGAASSALQPCFAALRQVGISAQAFFSHLAGACQQEQAAGTLTALTSQPLGATAEHGAKRVSSYSGYQPSEILGDFYLRLFTETRLLLCPV